MDMLSIVVFQTLGQAQLPVAAVREELKQQAGFQRAFFGVKMEDPGMGILCTEWSSRETAFSYCSSKSASLPGAKEMLGFTAAQQQQQQQEQQQQQGWRSILSAPCTEVFTAFGVEEGFADNVGRFVSAVDARPPEGYRGAAFGESVDLAQAVAGEEAVRMIIGWTSREAHLEAKGKPGAIQDNIHELRSLRKAVDLFHVEFKEL